MQGPDSFSFSDSDIHRDVKTGEMPAEIPTGDNNVLEEADAQDDTEDYEGDPEEVEEVEQEDGSEESSAESSDELEGNDFDTDVASIHDTVPDGYPACVVGKFIYHRYDDGWYEGRVLRQVMCSANTARNGKFAIKFLDSAREL